MHKTKSTKRLTNTPWAHAYGCQVSTWHNVYWLKELIVYLQIRYIWIIWLTPQYLLRSVPFFFFVKAGKMHYAPPLHPAPLPDLTGQGGRSFGGVWDSAPRHAATVAIPTKKPALLTRPLTGGAWILS